MAEIEADEFGNKGRAREWLARAVHAPRDPVWTAQGFIAPEWMPVSPVSGELGAFEWKVPVQGLAFTEQQREEGTAPFLIADEPEPVEIVAEVPEIADVEVVEAENTDVEVAEISEPEIITIEAQEAEPIEAEKDVVEEKVTESQDSSEDVKAMPVEKQTKDDIPAPAPEQFSESTEDTHRLPDDPGPKKPSSGKTEESWFG